MRRIKFEDAAELDRLAVVSGENAQNKNLFVYRDSRTGRVAPPHKAGSPGTVRAEMREKQVRGASNFPVLEFFSCLSRLVRA